MRELVILFSMDISMEIRYAKETDCVALSTISGESLQDSWGEKGFLEALLNPSVRVLVAEEGNRPVGYCVFSIAADEAEIQSIAVDKGHRRQGAGRGLFDETLRLSRENGVKALYLDVRDQNMGAKSFYEDMGMEMIAQRRNFYDNPREDGVIYRLEIKDA